MKRYGHGLVLGRFRPPHAGHHHLVRTARDRCERLTVLVCGSAPDPLALDDRVAWLREVHRDVRIVAAADLTDPSAVPTTVLRAAVPERIDAVFSSEPYGDELARRLGAEAVCVDPGRSVFPVSGSAVRKDPVGWWDFLEPPVRAALTRRVVVLGAESTGATTLALALAEHYRRRGGVWARTRCVPDYTDEYRGRRPVGALRSEEYPLIAGGQAEREEQAARTGSPVLFCDADAFALTIRHERHLGGASEETARVAARGRGHLWLLTDHRGVRIPDRGEETSPSADGPPADRAALRAWTTARLLTQLAHTGRRAAVLTGPHEERLATAVAAVDALLAGGWHLNAEIP
ncbi:MULTISPECIES: AAA family ATPase [Streptomyces]|uniref:AAA family ATPase n=1 Tax=Streptomyces solicathayae TaxID=3081768 RepID=A0ABZ0M0L7_9ACTN|nr:AAA family ATPase [Streptomyces sp. HUAS YS2]WOX25218.1 AAA family ATPase [Streptomyces sp. HUAS YS2]